MSLLELTLATAMLTTVMTSLSMLVRGGYRAWQAHESDLVAIESAHGALRHLLRNVRQAQSVVAITAAAENTGSISLVMPDGTTRVWARNAGANQVNHGVNAATDLLAEGIHALRFTGYKADGITVTTVPAEIHVVEATAVTQLEVGGASSRTVRCKGWIRTW